jgi:hypothetical protein
VKPRLAVSKLSYILQPKYRIGKIFPPVFNGGCIETKVAIRGCSKTSVFGTATLDLTEKRTFGRFSQEVVSKLTKFWNNLILLYNYPQKKSKRKQGNGPDCGPLYFHNTS